jgi:hypothetical protein
VERRERVSARGRSFTRMAIHTLDLPSRPAGLNSNTIRKST